MLLCKWDCLSKLPISLTVELISLDKDSTALLSGLEEDKIGWNALILFNLDDLTHFDVPGGDRHDSTETLLLALQDSILRIVQLFVPAEPIKVINTFFDHCDHEYEGKRCDVSEEEADFEKGHELTDCDDQEEHVKEELELIVEHFEDKREDVVLLVIQAI